MKSYLHGWVPALRRIGRVGKYGLILTLMIVIAGDIVLHVVGMPVDEKGMVDTLAPLLILLAAAAAIGDIGASIIAGAMPDRDEG